MASCRAEVEAALIAHLPPSMRGRRGRHATTGRSSSSSAHGRTRSPTITSRGSSVVGRTRRRCSRASPGTTPTVQASPLARFAELGGRILLLGSDHDQVTFLHHAEHLVDVPDKRVVRFQVPVLRDGHRVWRWMEEFDTSEPCHPAWPTDLFRRITDAFLRRTGNPGGRVGDAPSVVIEAPPLLAFALEVLAALVEDPPRARTC